MILLDSNILLEVLEHRRQYEDVIQTLANIAGKEILAITVLTVSNVFYIAERNKLDFQKVENLIKSYRHMDIVGADVDWAIAHYKNKDFEDALQVAAAIREKYTAFLTLDASLAKKYSKFLPIKLI